MLDDFTLQADSPFLRFTVKVLFSDLYSSLMKLYLYLLAFCPMSPYVFLFPLGEPIRAAVKDSVLSGTVGLDVSTGLF